MGRRRKPTNGNDLQRLVGGGCCAGETLKGPPFVASPLARPGFTPCSPRACAVLTPCPPLHHVESGDAERVRLLAADDDGIGPEGRQSDLRWLW